MSALTQEDLIAVQLLGGNILNRTFPDNAPPHLYTTLRNAGWNPVTVPPTDAQPDAKALANAAQAAEMPTEAFIAARNAGWTPGEPLSSV
ncbi:hypothetical protein JJL56_02310 [Azospirillum sp. YIM DDC1]|uniref:Uncharacterized protein n=1 Tax=Azospirillum aestuarii TaxID=2802052 RepID=A0ABS1HS93_9PROT|nr:hypothetical protein [Azospirillum aestuarii]MBK4717693.1 hypothetical protein [Azospirillum aestuarii]